MATPGVIVLGDLLRAALREELPDGLFYLPESSEIDLSTPVLLLTDSDLEDDESDIPRAASGRGFPREGLDTPTLVSVVRGATEFASPPSDDLLLEAFLYHHEFDAFLPRPGAPAPPPWSEVEQSLDRSSMTAWDRNERTSHVGNRGVPAER